GGRSPSRREAGRSRRRSRLALPRPAPVLYLWPLHAAGHMTYSQGLSLAVLAAAIALFLTGRWRPDVVALAALLACVLVRLVAPEPAFPGFGHPPVATVAARPARSVIPAKAGPTASIAALTIVGALLSGVMNNVGALALLMPLAIQRAAKLEIPAGRVLMPLAFGSILGGMTTLIGTPPNLVVSSFRAGGGPNGFGMFDFTPVGATVAAAGIAFVVLGWRLVPERKAAGAEGFETSAYLTEARV